MRRVSAGLHLWPRGPEGEPGLRHLEGRAHVPDGGGQLLHVLLLVKDLLHSARQVGPQVGVSRVRVCDALLERSGNSEYDKQAHRHYLYLMPLHLLVSTQCCCMLLCSVLRTSSTFALSL